MQRRRSHQLPTSMPPTRQPKRVSRSGATSLRVSVSWPCSESQMRSRLVPKKRPMLNRKTPESHEALSLNMKWLLRLTRFVSSLVLPETLRARQPPNMPAITHLQFAANLSVLLVRSLRGTIHSIWRCGSLHQRLLLVTPWSLSLRTQLLHLLCFLQRLQPSSCQRVSSMLSLETVTPDAR